jgi:hypothetical protein
LHVVRLCPFQSRRIRKISEGGPIIAEARSSLEEVRDEMFSKIAEEIKGSMRHRFLRAYSPGKLIDMSGVALHIASRVEGRGEKQ